jgi:hypothetical protein
MGMREWMPDNNGTTVSVRTQVDGPMHGTDEEAKGVQMRMRTRQLTEHPQ